MSSIVMSSPTARESRGSIKGRFALVGVGTVVAAVVANVLVYFIGSVLVGYDPGFVVLATVGGTILFTLVPAVVAVLLYAVLPRFTANPARVFRIIAAVVFVVTLIPDFTYIPTVPGASGGQTAILVLMHAVAASVIVGMLTTVAHPRPR
ncbi:MAG: hypothetical protein H0W06_09325 [Chloroflexia bacterium]|nr:hypothetical protein [Chloroflexia bacterium]